MICPIKAKNREQHEAVLLLKTAAATECRVSVCFCAVLWLCEGKTQWTGIALWRTEGEKNMKTGGKKGNKITKKHKNKTKRMH